MVKILHETYILSIHTHSEIKNTTKSIIAWFTSLTDPMMIQNCIEIYCMSWNPFSKEIIFKTTGWPVKHGCVFLELSEKCSCVHWTNHFLQSTRKTRPSLIYSSYLLWMSILSLILPLLGRTAIEFLKLLYNLSLYFESLVNCSYLQWMGILSLILLLFGRTATEFWKLF